MPKLSPPQPLAKACSLRRWVGYHRVPMLRSRRSTALAHASVSVVPPPIIFRVWCRRNVARNALTGRFPAFVFSMPSIANLYVAHARAVYAASASH